MKLGKIMVFYAVFALLKLFWMMGVWGEKLFGPFFLKISNILRTKKNLGTAIP